MDLFSEEYLMHHGILGQKWGVRRFQNADGSLTSAGAKRYKAFSPETKEYRNDRAKLQSDKINELWDKYDVDNEFEKAYETVSARTTDLNTGETTARRYETVDEKQLAKAEALEERVYKEAREYTKKALLEKYGEQNVAQLEKSANKADAISAGITAVGGTIAMGIAMYSLYQLIKPEH